MAIQNDKSSEKKLHKHPKLINTATKRNIDKQTLRCRDCEEVKCLNCEIFKNFTPDNY